MTISRKRKKPYCSCWVMPQKATWVNLSSMPIRGGKKIKRLVLVGGGEMGERTLVSRDGPSYVWRMGKGLMPTLK